MSTVAPTGSWSSTVSLTAGARYRYTATPGVGGSVLMQWTDGTNWYDFTNSAIGVAVTSLIPAAAIGIRGQGIGVAGSFDTASADPLYPSYLGNVADESAMTALTSAIIGQTCRRVDLGTLWVLIAQPASTAANWKELASGTADSSFSGSADRTNVVLEADPVNGGYRVYKYTESGLEWTISYDVSGQPVGYSALGGVLSRTISYTSGFGVASGNVFVAGGALSVLTASMASLQTALAALGTAVSQTFRVSDFDSSRAISLEWNHVNACFRGISGAPIVIENTGGFQNTSPGTSTITVFSATVPAWLKTVGSRYQEFCRIETLGDSDTKTVSHDLNGTPWWSAGAFPISTNDIEDTSTVIQRAAGTLTTQTTSFTGFARQTSTGNPGSVSIAAGTDLTFSVSVTYGGTAGGAANIINGISYVLQVVNP